MVWFWLAIGIALGAAEAFTTTLVLVMFAAGAFAAAVGAALGLPVWAQLIVFGAVSAAALGGLRPLIQRRRSGRRHPSDGIGLASIESASGLVLERVDQDHGLIKIDGELWLARPYDATQIFEPGERVHVIEIKGATALVWRD